MKPILLNTDRVRAILGGRKTVTRRVVKPQPEERRVPGETGCYIYRGIPCGLNGMTNLAPYRPGDILYVRETWAKDPFGNGYIFPTEIGGAGQKWHPSIHMPREAARIFLRVTSVRVERLQGIDDAGAKADGANWRNGKNMGFEEKMRRSSIDRFAEIWDSTIKPADRALYGWEANPYVLRIEFERCEKPKGD